MLEAHKHEHFIAPGLAWLINTSHHAREWGLTPEVTSKMGYHRELEVAVESLKAMRRRDVRICRAATTDSRGRRTAATRRTSSTSSNNVGMSTMEAMLSATTWGGPMMRMGRASSAT